MLAMCYRGRIIEKLDFKVFKLLDFRSFTITFVIRNKREGIEVNQVK